MARRQNEVTIKEASSVLEAHEDTIRSWCKAAVAGAESKLKGAVRRDLTSHYWIDGKRVADLRELTEQGLAEYL